MFLTNELEFEAGGIESDDAAVAGVGDVEGARGREGEAVRI